MPHTFAFRLFFPKRKAFAAIYRNVSLIPSVIIQQSRRLELQQASYHMASRALSYFIAFGYISSSCDKLASALAAM